ncbi:MAG: PadR family transcriptional regulator [Thermoplasmatales archaeon]
MNGEFGGWRHRGMEGWSGTVRGHHTGFGLRYLILGITQKQPSTGAMIMDSLEQITMGRWRPSPGHVYPLLEEMTDEGLLNMEIKEGRKFYSPTDKGKQVLDESWFPWRFAQGIQTSSYKDAIRNLELLTDFLVDSKDKIKEDPEAKKKIKDIIDRLQYI